MNLSHQKAFIYIQKEIDDHLSLPAREELKQHLAVCPECRSSARLARHLAQTRQDLLLPESREQKTNQQIAHEILSYKLKRQKLQVALQVGAWTVLALLLVTFIGWSIENLRTGQSTAASSILNEITRFINSAATSISILPNVPKMVVIPTLDPSVVLIAVVQMSGLIPILFISVIGVFMGLRKADTGWLIFLITALGLVIGFSIWSLQSAAQGFGLLAIPVIITITSMLVIHLWETRGMWSPISLIMMLFYAAGLFVLISGPWYTPRMQASFPRANFIIILGAGVILSITWLAGEWQGPARRVAFVFTSIVALGVAASFFYFSIEATLKYRWTTTIFGLILFLCPFICVALAARLIVTWQSGSAPYSRLQTVLRLFNLGILFAFLFAFMRINAIRNSTTEEQIIGTILLYLVFCSAANAAVSIAWKLSGKRLAISLAFILIFCLALIPSVNISPGLGYQLTERRAGELNQAILRFHAQNKRYPTDLTDLTPFYILFIPEPVTYHATVWCYDGNTQYYRLGYYFSQSFPYNQTDVSVKIFASAGELPTGLTPCEVNLATGHP